MEYVFRFLFAFAVTWVGCMLAILIMRRRLDHYIDCLGEINDEIEFLEDTRPDNNPYAWFTNEHLPGCEDDYVVEYHFGDPKELRYTVAHFDVDELRFEVEGCEGMIVTHWTYMPE